MNYSCIALSFDQMAGYPTKMLSGTLLDNGYPIKLQSSTLIDISKNMVE